MYFNILNVLYHTNVYSILTILMLNINLIFSCTHIRVTSKNSALEPLIGDYLLDPTIIANGRPVYISTSVDEDTEPKKNISFFK